MVQSRVRADETEGMNHFTPFLHFSHRLTRQAEYTVGNNGEITLV